MTRNAGEGVLVGVIVAGLFCIGMRGPQKVGKERSQVERVAEREQRYFRTHGRYLERHGVYVAPDGQEWIAQVEGQNGVCVGQAQDGGMAEISCP